MEDGSVASPLLDGNSIKGGWASSVYIIVAETAERFAMYGATANLITYLTNVLGQPTATAAKSVNIYAGIATLFPLLGALVADAYLGPYNTILVSSMIYVIGLALLTLSVWIVPIEIQLVPFFLSLYLIGIGQGGHGPCLKPFGADQFDQDSLEDKKAKSGFFNWCFLGANLGASAGIVIVCYVQENVGWVVGYTIPAIVMAVGLLVFLLGQRSYRKHKPSGSPLTRIMQVFVAAFRKRHLSVSQDYHTKCYGEGGHVGTGAQPCVQILPCTTQFKCLDKAAIMDDIDELSITKNNWRLCTVPQIEEVKLLLRLVPIWLCCLMYALVFAQGGTFFTKQGSTMDTSIGNSFHISPASLLVFTGLSGLVFIPIYDKLFVPIATSFTGFRSGIMMLQRIGVGMFLATSSMVVAGLVESRRIRVASEHGLLDQPNATVPMSVWWLLPQYLISGISNVFAVVGLQELFYDQMPDSTRSIGSAMQLCVFGVGSLLSGVVISLVQYVSIRTGDEWLVNNLNRAHLDYYYLLLAGLSGCGFFAFIGVAVCFIYKKVDGDYTPRSKPITSH